MGMKSQKNYPKIFSMEFFPPKTPESACALNKTLGKIAPLQPRFCSVTFGAGGSTREKTFETVLTIQNVFGLPAAPHLSCIASTKENIREVLHTYLSQGIQHIVALRGDMPSGMFSAGEFRHANELVCFIRNETGARFHIEVAAYPEVHPQALNLQADLAHFKRKVESGANSAITQYFFNPDAYFRFIDECEKQDINIPIVPGIMPITNYAQLARFSDLCGADIPRWLKKRLELFGDDRNALRAFGIDVITELADRLLQQGAPGLHFYTLNQSDSVLAIWENLHLSNFSNY